MKIFHSIVCVLFFLGAVVQLNDPDPWLWVLIYGLVAVVAGFAVTGKHIPVLTGAAFAACLLGAILAAPGFFEYVSQHLGEDILQGMSDDRMYIEETREFLGMCLALGLMGFYVYLQRKPSASPEPV